MSEERRFRLLCFVARRLGFDLSEVTPEELRKPQPPPKPQVVDWYVYRINTRSVYAFDKWIDVPEDCHLAEKFGPMFKSEAIQMLRQLNRTPVLSPSLSGEG